MILEKRVFYLEYEEVQIMRTRMIGQEQTWTEGALEDIWQVTRGDLYEDDERGRR